MSDSDTGFVSVSRPMPPKRGSAGAHAYEWWKRMRDPTSGDPGMLARLRRCRGTLDAMGIRAALILARKLGAAHRDVPDSRTRDAVDLARILAHVKEHDQNKPMRAAGWKHFAGNRKESEAGDDRPRLAEARFRRLLDTGDGEEKVTAFIRLIALLGDAVNVEDLANDFLDWSNPEKRDRVRERWAFQYYAAGSAMPVTSADDHATQTTPDTEDAA